MKPARGFSLLEVLAAMVIFSAGSALLFNWISSAARQIARLGEEQRQLFGELLALEYSRTLNPMTRPTGDVELDSVRVRWMAEPVGDEGAVQGGTGDGNYIVRLYKVRLMTQAPKAAERARDVYLTGWREQAVARSGSSLFGAGTPGPDVPR